MKSKIKKPLTVSEAGRKESTNFHIYLDKPDSADCKSTSALIFSEKIQEGEKID